MFSNSKDLAPILSNTFAFKNFFSFSFYYRLNNSYPSLFVFFEKWRQNFQPNPKSAEPRLLKTVNLPKIKYEKSSLKETQKEAIKQKLLTLMETTQPYLNSKLTIGDMAQQLHLSPYYLSQVINEKLQVNFLDFINVYRINAAKAMLANQKMAHYTVRAIAYEAGFHSKSSFYNAFKKNTCMTPFQYRKQYMLG